MDYDIVYILFEDLTGAVAEWIKAVAFEAMKLSNREVWSSIPGRVKVRWVFHPRAIYGFPI